ncbi:MULTISPECIES: aminofutalosine deaminase family hydrolase [unclassified Campylobacter]|uniref:aminofutalosine deaminase family hydrolase n=1 Tax=unclassified Campylobacter TaxID=2593542 RepID=UPI003D35162A
MQILKAKFIITCDENFTIHKNSCIAFDEKILAIGDESELKQRFKGANFSNLGNAIITPALINTHTHLEFSANKTQLIYGDFIAWLSSIVENGAKLACDDKIMQSALNSMLASGVGTIGAISSFGKDLQILASSQARVVFFNEILGSNEAFVEQNFKAFSERFLQSSCYQNKLFTPAISLHAPYSIHPKLAKMAINLVKSKNLVVSTHFMESLHEQRWLKNGSGKFKSHLKRFTPDPKPLYTKEGYFSMFSGIRTLFTHCVYESDFSAFESGLHSVTHCASSNRLLGKRALNLAKLKKANVSLNIGTDGLSSNISLNMFDELRNVLFTHQTNELNSLAKFIFLAATKGGAQALGLENGILKEGKLADIAVFAGFDEIDEGTLITQLILHTKRALGLYVGGQRLI